MSQDSSHVGNVPPLDPIHLEIESRLAELKNEYQKGQLRLQRLQAELADLQQVMLRLSGAITVLEELTKPRIEGSSGDGGWSLACASS